MQHYVGDLRAVNNDVLDLYQLKSQVAIADNYDFEVSNPKAETYFAREADGKIYCPPRPEGRSRARSVSA